MDETAGNDTGGDAKTGRGGNRYAAWAALYAVSERTVKRWAAHGLDCGDKPPLDSPAEMAAWWSRRMTNRPPRGIIEAMAVPAAVPADEPVIRDAPPDGRGVAAELDRLEHLAATLSVRAHEPGQAKPYLDTVARMVALTRQMREEGEKLGRLLPRDMVEMAIHEFHGPIEREIRLLYRTMSDIIGLPATPEKEDAWNREIDRLCIRFGGEVLA